MGIFAVIPLERGYLATLQMDQPTEIEAFMKYSYEELAKMIDHSLLHPTMTDAELEAGCQARCRSTMLPRSASSLTPSSRRSSGCSGSDVKVGAVVGFPHGILHRIETLRNRTRLPRRCRRNRHGDQRR